MKCLIPVTLLLAAGLLSAPAFASGTDSKTFLVKLTIDETCDIHTTPPTNLVFPTTTRQSGAVSVLGSSTITVKCSSGTAYWIGLNTGINGARNMRGTSAGNTGTLVPYELYTPLSTVWGNTSATGVSGSGNGSNQTLSVSGKVTNVDFPGDTYEDTVTATVNY